MAIGRTMFIDRVDRGTGDTILQHINASDAPLRVAQLRVLGGAMSRVAPDATAYAHLDRRILVNVASFYTGDADRPKRQAWVNELAGALDQGVSGAYVNFLNNEGPVRVSAAYPGETGERLRRLKQLYDPTNVFRRNENIAPI